MKFKILFTFLCLIWGSKSSIEPNKTKRGLLEQTRYYGETTDFRPILYPDNIVSPTQQQPGLSNYYTPKYNPAIKPVYEQEPKVTTQQVHYEYQQTPHNTISNVHVNQQYQTAPEPVDNPEIAYTQYVTQHHRPQYVPNHNQQPQINQNSHVETIVSPVHHSAIIQHAPYVPNPNPHNHFTAGKYVYANGKVIYVTNPQNQPIQSAVHQQPTIQQPPITHAPQPLQSSHQPMHPSHPINQQQYYNQRVYQKKPQPKLTPPPQSAPVHYQNYQKQKPAPRPVAPKKEEIEEEAEDDEEEKADVKEDDDEEEESDHEGYTEEDDEEEEDRPRAHHKEKEESEFGRYSFEEDYNEDDKAANKREEDDEDDDEDAHGHGSHNHHKKHSRPSKRTRYSSSSKNTKKYKPKSNYQAYSYKKGSNGKPKIEMIQGQNSKQIPVTVKKIYREKWYIARNSDHDQ